MGEGSHRIPFSQVFSGVTVVRVVPGMGLNPPARLSGRLLAVPVLEGEYALAGLATPPDPARVGIHASRAGF